MLISYRLTQTGVILRVKCRRADTGQGFTGLTNASFGLIIAAAADNEAATTAYTVSGATIDTVATRGTYSAPTSGHCRFREFDAINHPGLYELQLENSRFAVGSAKSLLVTISGVLNLAECDALVPLTSIDPYDGVRAGLTVFPNVAQGNAGQLALGDASGRVTTTYQIRKNVAIGAFPFVMYLASDHVTPATGLTPTATISKDGGGFGSTTNAPAVIANGAYKIDLAAADLNANTIVLRITAGTADDVLITFITQV